VFGKCSSGFRTLRFVRWRSLRVHDRAPQGASEEAGSLVVAIRKAGAVHSLLIQGAKGLERRRPRSSSDPYPDSRRETPVRPPERHHPRRTQSTRRSVSSPRRAEPSTSGSWTASIHSSSRRPSTLPSASRAPWVRSRSAATAWLPPSSAAGSSLPTSTTKCRRPSPRTTGPSPASRTPAPTGESRSGPPLEAAHRPISTGTARPAPAACSESRA
jgi:hypothetical protein